MDSDSPWEENPDEGHAPEVEWTKITAEFTNAGYREGIIAGKEAFLQAGFDAGFAAGVPVGREIGLFRGAVVAVRAFMSAQNSDSVDLEEISAISSALSNIRFSDIAPRDLEAEQHAKEHDIDDSTITVDSSKAPQERPTMEDVTKLKERLAALCAKLELPVLA